MILGGLQKTSLLDFPEKISAIVFTAGCNFRCGYCHNPELINSIAHVDDVFEFLKLRQGKLDGVVITGGEPCIQKDLPEFIKRIKNLGFAIKLDTNGSNPYILEKVLPDLSYIAMDIKAPLNKYQKITGVNIDTNNIIKSINLLKNSSVSYEFRTTVVKSQLDIEDFEEIGKLIQDAPLYYLQKFVPSKILDKSLQNETTYSKDEFIEIQKILTPYVKKVIVR